MRLPGKTNTQKSTFIRSLRCPRLAGYKVLRVQLPGPRATVSHVPPGLLLLLSAGSRASTTWWRKALVFSKCVQGGCFTFLIKMWSHAATLNKRSCVTVAQFRGPGLRTPAGRREPPYGMCQRTLGLLLTQTAEEFSGSKLSLGFGSSLPQRCVKWLSCRHLLVWRWLLEADPSLAASQSRLALVPRRPWSHPEAPCPEGE